MIRLDKEDGLWIATIDRPEKANSLTAEMLETLSEIAEAAVEARVLVLTGTGKVFSAGADLEATKAGLATSPLWERLSGALAALPCLTICALNGTIAGGAMGMALACDLRLSVPGAKVFYPVMKLGFLPQPSDPARLAALVGPARAKMILMAGAKVPVEEAQSWGLIDRIVEGDVLEEARVLAADTLAANPAHARAIKELIPSGVRVEKS
ncbi:MAG: enoyl-CoA hydratase/isomerase family protein [Paracoccaceae bacterium]|nr:enoyl-CoA hydratase/isomerase family protein [Paracoccaceae bacterium]